MTNLEHAATTLRNARHVLVLTGAGISAESGIPTFRDALTGLWARYDAESLATAQAFQRDPALVWGWYEWRRGAVLRTRPNGGHVALAKIEQRVPAFTLVTQNVDDLHERAGSAAPIHLHGSLSQPRCFVCAAPFALPPGAPDEPEGGRHLTPPACLACGGPVRPGVVWFGEGLPMHAWEAAKAAAQRCDVMLVIGTSGLVYPAASLPALAAANGAAMIQINLDPAPLNTRGVMSLTGPAGLVVPALVAAAWPSANDRPA